MNPVQSILHRLPCLPFQKVQQTQVACNGAWCSYAVQKVQEWCAGGRQVQKVQQKHHMGKVQAACSSLLHPLPLPFLPSLPHVSHVSGKE